MITKPKHDDVIKWKHFPHYWPFVRGLHRPPVNSRHKGQWCGALIFSLICTRINGWVNNGEAGDLRRHHAHYDVTAMMLRVRYHQRPPKLIIVSMWGRKSKLYRILSVSGIHNSWTSWNSYSAHNQIFGRAHYIYSSLGKMGIWESNIARADMSHVLTLLWIMLLDFYSLRRHRLTGIGIPIINLRRSDDRLRFIMGIPILIRRRLLRE